MNEHNPIYGVNPNPPSSNDTFDFAMPDIPEPASFGLTKGFYVGSEQIVTEVCKMLGRFDLDILSDAPKEHVPHDVPGDWFKGPF